jgi:hypothetical protein
VFKIPFGGSVIAKETLAPRKALALYEGDHELHFAPNRIGIAFKLIFGQPVWGFMVLYALSLVMRWDGQDVTIDVMRAACLVVLITMTVSIFKNRASLTKLFYTTANVSPDGIAFDGGRLRYQPADIYDIHRVVLSTRGGETFEVLEVVFKRPKKRNRLMRLFWRLVSSRDDKVSVRL